MGTKSIHIEEIITANCEICRCILEDDVLIIGFSSVVNASTMEVLDDISLVIFNWSKLVISKFITPTPSAEGHWEEQTELDIPETIDVIRISGNKLTLEGRSSTDGSWMKFTIYDSKQKISSADDVS